MTLDARRIAAFALLLLAVCDYALIYRPLQSAIGERAAALETARTGIERSLAAVRALPALERERTMLLARVHAAHADERRTAATARFVHAVAQLAARDGVAVWGLLPATAAPATQRAGAPAPLLDEIGFELTLRGEYAVVLRALRDLAHEDPAAQIAPASLGDVERRGARPQLNAALHVTLLHLPDA